MSRRRPFLHLGLCLVLASCGACTSTSSVLVKDAPYELKARVADRGARVTWIRQGEGAFEARVRHANRTGTLILAASGLAVAGLGVGLAAAGGDGSASGFISGGAAAVLIASGGLMGLICTGVYFGQRSPPDLILEAGDEASGLRYRLGLPAHARLQFVEGDLKPDPRE